MATSESTTEQRDRAAAAAAAAAKPLQWCLTLCDPMDCSMPGLPVLHHLQELAQIRVH